MTIYLGKSCSFSLPRVPFVNFGQIVFSYFPFGFEGSMWDLIVSVPDHCLSFYFVSVRIAAVVDKINKMADCRFSHLEGKQGKFFLPFSSNDCIIK